MRETTELARKLVAHFGGCVNCVDDHGSYPESVSCYCNCHDGAEKRWPALREAALAILAETEPEK
jgi:hypothetical protein